MQTTHHTGRALPLIAALVLIFTPWANAQRGHAMAGDDPTLLELGDEPRLKAVQQVQEKILIDFAAARFEEAIRGGQTVLYLCSQVLGEDHLHVSRAHNNLGLLYQQAQRIDDAEASFGKALQILEGTWAPILEKTLVQQNLASLYSRTGRAEQALALMEQVLEYMSKNFGEQNPKTAEARKNLADYYMQISDFEEALRLFKHVLAIEKAVYGPMHPRIANTLGKMGVCYDAGGDYSTARIYFDKSLEIAIRLMGRDHPQVIANLNNLAGLEAEMSNYVRALLLYLEVEEREKNNLSETHRDHVVTANNLAALFNLVGGYQKAEDYYKKAIELGGRVLGKNHPTTLKAMFHLAELYVFLERYADAEKWLQASLPADSDHGADRFLARRFEIEATLLGKRGLLNEAVINAEKAYKTRKSKYGDFHPFTARSLRQLATLFHARAQLMDAEAAYIKALEINQRILGSDHPNIALSLAGLAAIKTAHNSYPDATAYLEKALVIDSLTIERVFGLTSERDKLAFLNTLTPRFNQYQSLVINHCQGQQDVLARGFLLALKRKGIVLESMREAASPESGDPTIQSKNKALTAVRNQLSALMLDGPNPRSPHSFQDRLKQLQERVDTLERELALSTTHSAQSFELADITRKMPGGSVLLEFISYRAYDAATNSPGEERLAAYVLTSNPSASLSLIELGPMDPIEEAVGHFSRAIHATLKETGIIGRRLFQMVLAPVLVSIGQDAEMLLIAADGPLHLLPFEALPMNESTLVIDRFRIGYLNSGKDLLRASSVPEGNGLFIFAVSSGHPTLNGRPLSPLPGVKKEASAIANLWPGFLKGFFMDINANELRIKSLRSPKWLHLATHGLFMPDESKWTTLVRQGPIGRAVEQHIPLIESQNPLRNGVLALAARPESKEDGFLTALEIMNMDLRGTDMVVLSACDTGRGKIRNGEGVFGLRRAFTIAGARTLIMSLWKVGDESTALLMEYFYQELKKDLSKPDALRQAKLRFRKEKPEPYFWAGFVCIGPP